MEAELKAKLEKIARAKVDNEDEVKDKVASPLFALLEYEKGESNNIDMEEKTYAPGTRPKSADYVLSVAGKKKLVVEAKVSFRNRTEKEQEANQKQAQYYAKNLELNLYAVLDESKLHLFSRERRDEEICKIDIKKIDSENEWNRFKSYFSPQRLYYHTLENWDEFFEIPPTDDIDLENLNDKEKRNLADFFRGRLDNWLPILADSIVSRQVIEDDGGPTFSIEEWVQELQGKSEFQVSFLFAPGGAGKSTGVRKAAVEWQRAGQIVLYRTPISKTPNYGEVKKLAQDLHKIGLKLFIIYDNPVQNEQARELFDISKYLQNEDNVAIVIAVRKDEWLEAFRQNRSQRFNDQRDFTLKEAIALEGMNKLVDVVRKLEEGSITILAEGQSIESFETNIKQEKNKPLLSIVYEATVGEAIEEILKNEFDNIPSEEAKEIYKLVAGLNCYGLRISIPLLEALYDKKLLNKIFKKEKHLEGIVWKIRGHYTIRHRNLAEILWNQVRESPEDEIEFFEECFRKLRESTGDSQSMDIQNFAFKFFDLFEYNDRFSNVQTEFFVELLKSLTLYVPDRKALILFVKLGQLWLKRGNKELAKEAFRAGIDRSPGPELFTALGQAQLKDGDTKGAIATFRDGLQKSPGPGLYTALGQAQLKDGDTKGAIATFRDGIRKDPDSKLFFELSLAEWEHGDKAECLKILQDGINRYPMDSDLQNELKRRQPE